MNERERLLQHMDRHNNLNLSLDVVTVYKNQLLKHLFDEYNDEVKHIVRFATLNILHGAYPKKTVLIHSIIDELELTYADII